MKVLKSFQVILVLTLTTIIFSSCHYYKLVEVDTDDLGGKDITVLGDDFVAVHSGTEVYAIYNLISSEDKISGNFSVLDLKKSKIKRLYNKERLHIYLNLNPTPTNKGQVEIQTSDIESMQLIDRTNSPIKVANISYDEFRKIAETNKDEELAVFFPNRNIVLHTASKEYLLKDAIVNENSVSGNISKVDRKIYYGYTPTWRYVKSTQSDVLNEAHIYLKDKSGMMELGPAEIPFDEIESIWLNEENRDKRDGIFIAALSPVAAGIVFSIIWLIIVLPID